MSDAQKRIALAIIGSATLVAVAFFLRSNTTVNDVDGTVVSDTSRNAVVIPGPTRTAIRETDTDNNGIPDWQEALQQSEALTLDKTNEVAFTEPDTLTDQFALEFFEKIMRSKTYGDFGDNPEELIINASNELAQSAQDTLLTQSDITISPDNTPEALTRYGEHIARIILEGPTDTGENEAVILDRAIRNADATELAILSKKIAVYGDMLAKTKALTTPSAATAAHLALLNSYQAMLVDITAMQAAFTDPMFTLLRMKRYQEDVDGLAYSIANMFDVLAGAGAHWEASSPVFRVVRFDNN